MNDVVYNLICEKTDEPCSAEVRSFRDLETAKDVLKKIMNDYFDNLVLEADVISDACDSLKDSDGMSFTILLYPDDEVEVNCRIERTVLE